VLALDEKEERVDPSLISFDAAARSWRLEVDFVWELRQTRHENCLAWLVSGRAH
jgi:hypothetical protein